MLGTVCFVSAANPWIFLCTVPLGCLFVYLRNYYMKFGRDIKRIEATARSPVFSHFSSSLAGLAIVRCHQAGPRFYKQMCKLLDDHGRAYYMFMSANRWLGIRVDFMASVVVIAIVFVAILARNSLSTGLVAMSIVYSLQLLLGIQWMLRQVSLRTPISV